MRNICWNVPPRPTDQFYWFCSKNSACLPPVGKFSSTFCSFLLPATTTQLFSQFLSFRNFYSCFEVFPTADNLCNFWRSKFQHISIQTWDDILTLKWNCRSPNKLCKCTGSPFTLSANTLIEWSLYLYWSNHREIPFSLVMIVGGFSKNRKRTRTWTDTSGSFSPLLSLKSMWRLLEKSFQQRSRIVVN